MTADVKIVTDASFATDVLESGVPVLVDFWAPWCGPCRMVAPVLERVAESYAGRVVVAKLNVDENPATAMRYQIRSIPTVALFDGGDVVDGITGAVPEKYYRDLLDQRLAGAAAER